MEFKTEGWRLLAGAILIALISVCSLPRAAHALETVPFDGGLTGFPIAESATRASFTIALDLVETKGDEQEVLELRGRRTTSGNTGTYNVSAGVSATPCPGTYRLSADQENSLNGYTLTYGALMKLVKPAGLPAGAGCDQLPRSTGRVLMGLRNPVIGPLATVFALDVRKQGGGTFAGTLMSGALPACAGGYRLETELVLPGRRRSLDLEVQMLEVRRYIQGQGEGSVEEPC
ncbi:MAG: hypothetical protein ABW196_00125 [Solirubrobacterales bacterium]